MMAIIKPNDKYFAHTALLLTPGLSLSARRVGAAIVDHFNKYDGQCDPSVGRLARLLGISRRSVLDATNDLCSGDDALFERISHGGASHRTTYTPRWDRFRVIVADWNRRFKIKGGEAPSNVQKVAPSRCENLHFDSAENCTQTVLNNRSKEPSEVEVHRSEAANLPPHKAANHHPSDVPNRRNGLQKESAKPDRQRFMVHVISRGWGAIRKDAAEGAAQRQLTKSIQSLGDVKAREAAWLVAMDEGDDPERPSSLAARKLVQARKAAP